MSENAKRGALAAAVALVENMEATDAELLAAALTSIHECLLEAREQEPGPFATICGYPVFEATVRLASKTRFTSVEEMKRSIRTIHASLLKAEAKEPRPEWGHSIDGTGRQSQQETSSTSEN